MKFALFVSVELHKNQIPQFDEDPTLSEIDKFLKRRGALTSLGRAEIVV